MIEAAATINLRVLRTRPAGVLVSAFAAAYAGDDIHDHFESAQAECHLREGPEADLQPGP